MRKFQEVCERREGKLIIAGDLNARVDREAEVWERDLENTERINVIIMQVFGILFR